MGIKFTGDFSAIAKEAEAQYQSTLDGIIEIMEYVGEDFVRDAKQALNIKPGAFPKGNYDDQTANLRSSIGYYILLDGSLLGSKIEGTAEGQDAGASLLARIQKDGLQLIGVAGMDYASRVESKGYNVITSQQDMAIVDLSQHLKDYAATRGVKLSRGKSFKTQMKTFKTKAK